MKKDTMFKNKVNERLVYIRIPSRIPYCTECTNRKNKSLYNISICMNNEIYFFLITSRLLELDLFVLFYSNELFINPSLI